MATQTVARRLAITALILGAVACGGDADQFSLHLSWRTDGSFACPQATCSAFELRCDAMVAVRIIDAEDPERIYVDECIAMPAAPDLCGLRALPMPGDHEVPNRAVRVQVSIWPTSQVGNQCPTTVEYDPRGLPQSRGMHPAIGGEKLVVAGADTTVDLALACPNVPALTSDVCLADQPIRVTSTVEDFAQRSTVPMATAEYLIVSAGQPVERPLEGEATQWELPPNGLSQLDRDDASRIEPWWTGSVPPNLAGTVCLEVLHRTEGGPTATCRLMPSRARSLELRGAYVPPSLRKVILDALGVDALPGEGLVLGRVVDDTGAPIAGIVVKPDPAAAVVYVAADGARLDGAITETSVAGMWVSIDAPPGTTWSVGGSLPSPVNPSAVGGRIAGHLTVVELVLGAPATQE